VEKADNTSVSFRYDASGNRIAKIASGDTTVYVRDASGNVMGVYKNDTLIEQSIYGSSRLGLLTQASKTGYRTLGGKKYELSNHLGNVLAVVSDNINLDQDSTWASVVNVTDYYPFGLAMEGRSLQDSAYRYGFNGKELDGGGEWGGQNNYDYGFRIYNPSIAKFLSVDPLAANYPYFTPYQFAGNKPVMFIDLDGAEFQIPTFEKFKYGNNAAMNVVTVVDNVAINAVNGSITLVNSGIYTIHKVFTDPTSIPEELKSDLGAMATETRKYFRNQYGYAANTPISRQLTDVAETLRNPESYEGPAELATALFLTKNANTFGNSVSKRGSVSNNWIDETGNIKWPKNDGFLGTPDKVNLTPGMRFDRYGAETGSFASPLGTPPAKRSLAPGTASKPLTKYEVAKQFDALGGEVAPWFNEPGGGVQYKFQKSVKELLDEGYIKKID